MSFTIPYTKRIRPAAVAGKADMELMLSASTCYIDGPNFVNHGQFLLVYSSRAVVFKKNVLNKG